MTPNDEINDEAAGYNVLHQHSGVGQPKRSAQEAGEMVDGADEGRGDEPTRGTPEAAPILRIDEFRGVIRHLDGEVPVVIAVRDRNHFNTLLAAIPVIGASVTQGAHGPVVILDVADVT
ncbi:MAG TPA: hypothetical protein VKP64_01205 [Mycobacteriales bacterium]|nr:hypothetical protein [Mycobacteriales bacterium]